jgi:hypothetical protein
MRNLFNLGWKKLVRTGFFLSIGGLLARTVWKYVGGFLWIIIATAAGIGFMFLLQWAFSV